MSNTFIPEVQDVIHYRLFVRRMVVVLSAVLFLTGFGSFRAASDKRPAEERGAMALGQAILKLGVVASVLHTGAHPDDEDSGLLAYLARGRQARTAYLSLTRGDGGQNLIGPEIYEALGVIRTEELLAARRMDGAEQFFSRAYDFGFSKSRTEALTKWDREAVLGDMVRVIRTFRPLVIVSQWSGTPNDGHGHHQAAGFLTMEAYRAAADPARFPEQISEGLKPWKARKLYVPARERRRMTPNKQSDTSTLTINTGQFDNLLGRSYFEIAMEGRSQHRSQSEGSLERRGPQYSRLRLIESSVGSPKQESDIFQGLDTTLSAIAECAGPLASRLMPLLAEAQASADEAKLRFNPLTSSQLTPIIARGLTSIRKAQSLLSSAQLDAAQQYEAQFLLSYKERDFEDALAKAEGVIVDCLADDEVVTPNQTFGVAVSTYSGGTSKQEAVSIAVPAGWSVVPQKETRVTEQGRQVFQKEFKVTVGREAQFTGPYWLKNPRRGDMFVPGPGGTGIEPWAYPPVVANIQMQIGGERVRITQPAQFRYADKALGELRRELKVAPALSLTVAPRLIINQKSSANTAHEVRVTITNNSTQPVRGLVRLAPAGTTHHGENTLTVKPESAVFDLKRDGETQTNTFSVAVRAGEESGGAVLATATVAPDGHVEDFGYNTVAYSHIEPRFIYKAPQAAIDVIDVKVAPGLKVGYIEGAGDYFDEALKQLGVALTIIDQQELTTGDLSKYDSIVTGVRVYEVRPDVVANNSRLLSYVENGGTLIVQYNRNEYAAGNFAPFPLVMESRRERAESSQREQPRLVYVPTGEVINMLDPTNVADLRVAVIGSADGLAETLRGRNARVTLLAANELSSRDFNQFDVIVTGGGAKEAPEIAKNNNRLLDYSKRGTLLVAYSPAEYQSGDFPKWPRTDSRPYRVTDERARVELLDQTNPLFNYPNRISERDFEGWVQERGIYFMSEWDPKFKPMLSSHDPGEEPRLGGELLAPYGRGWYVYTGYAWFRELPEGVPGAYRLVANLVSLPKASSAGSRR